MHNPEDNTDRNQKSCLLQAYMCAWFKENNVHIKRKRPGAIYSAIYSNICK